MEPDIIKLPEKSKIVEFTVRTHEKTVKILSWLATQTHSETVDDVISRAISQMYALEINRLAGYTDIVARNPETQMERELIETRDLI